jgi:hypothetical protein
MKRGLFGFPSAPMLTHFTRASARARALDNLIGILETGILAGATRMVTGGRRAVCLFDAPMAELKRLLNPRNRRRYQPFGVAVDKRYAFAMGARPVIYLPAGEARAILKPEEMWRVVSIELDRARPVDWTFEREWRVAGDLALKRGRCVALVESWRDAEEIFDRFGGRPPCAGVIPLDGIFEAS